MLRASATIQDRTSISAAYVASLGLRAIYYIASASLEAFKWKSLFKYVSSLLSSLLIFTQPSPSPQLLRTIVLLFVDQSSPTPFFDITTESNGKYYDFQAATADIELEMESAKDNLKQRAYNRTRRQADYGGGGSNVNNVGPTTFFGGNIGFQECPGSLISSSLLK